MIRLRRAILILAASAALAGIMIPVMAAVEGTGVGTTVGGGGGFTGGTVTGATTFTAQVDFGSAAGAASSISFNETPNCITGEGTAADGSEGRICFGNPGIDSSTSLVYLQAAQTFAILEGAQTFSGSKTFSGNWTLTSVGLVDDTRAIHFGNTSGNGTPALMTSTTQTPDAMVWATGTTANMHHIYEKQDSATDFQNCSAGTSAATNPTLCIHSATAGTTAWIDFTHDNSNGVITTGTGELALAPAAGVRLNTNKYIYSVSTGAANGTIYGGASSTGVGMYFPDGGLAFSAGSQPRLQFEDSDKALTESSATTVVTVGVAASAIEAGEIIYAVKAADASDTQVRHGRVSFTGLNKAGAESCHITGYDGTANPDELKDGSRLNETAGASTLDYDWTAVAGTNTCEFKLNAVSSLTQTSLVIKYAVIKNGATGAITP